MPTKRKTGVRRRNPDRDHWPDGRMKAAPGDTVFRSVPGLYGVAIVTGVITRAGRVKAQGKSYPATAAWSVMGDPAVARREDAKVRAAAAAKVAKEDTAAAARAAVEAYAARHGLRRVGSVDELSVGDIVHRLSSEGAYGDGDPDKIHATKASVDAIVGNEFDYETPHGSVVGSGDVRAWWRGARRNPSRARRSTARRSTARRSVSRRKKSPNRRRR